jgi:hypothetical protein
MAKEKMTRPLSEVVDEKITAAICENAKRIGKPDRFDLFEAADEIRLMMDLWKHIHGHIDGDDGGGEIRSKICRILDSISIEVYE